MMMMMMKINMGVSQKGGAPKKRHPRRPLGSPGLYWRGALLRMMMVMMMKMMVMMMKMMMITMVRMMRCKIIGVGGY